MKLTEKERKEQERKHWFLKAAYEGRTIKNWHHTIPKHHGGENSKLVHVTLMEHALLHFEIWIDEGCKTCLKSYNSLKGLHDEWNRIQETMKDNGALMYFYDKKKSKKNKNIDVMSTDVIRVDDVVDVEAEEKIHSDTDKETLKDEVNQSLDTLKGRERKVIKMFFGIDRDCALTLNQIGEKFNLTGLRVNQIKEKAIRRLQHRSRANSLRVYA